MSKPYTISYDRSILNFTLIDLYESYADVLEKYGLLHVRGLLFQLMPTRTVQTYGDVMTDQHASFDTVLVQKGVRVDPCMSVMKDVKVKTVKKMVKREMGGLDEKVFERPDEVYWRSVDESLKENLPNEDHSGEMKHEDKSNHSTIPTSFTAHYGILMDPNVEALQKLDIKFPRTWCQHDHDFAGERNLLTRLNQTDTILMGINSPYSYHYYGTAFTSFPHHFEDFFLPSVNFLYKGSVKVWIGAPSSDTRRVWEVIQQVAKWTGKKADEKKLVLSPRVLKHVGGVEVCEVWQEPGDVVISASGATHGGFNVGENLAEAVNFVDKEGCDGWLADFDAMEQFYLDERSRSVPSDLAQLLTQQ